MRKEPEWGVGGPVGVIRFEALSHWVTDERGERSVEGSGCEGSQTRKVDTFWCDIVFSFPYQWPTTVGDRLNQR